MKHKITSAADLFKLAGTIRVLSGTISFTTDAAPDEPSAGLTLSGDVQVETVAEPPRRPAPTASRATLSDKPPARPSAALKRIYRDLQHAVTPPRKPGVTKRTLDDMKAEARLRELERENRRLRGLPES